MINHQHVYSSLRSALIDRDRDPTFIQENGILLTIGDDAVALKKSVPSFPLFISYTMLFWPNFIQASKIHPQKAWPAVGWIGGEANISYPVLFNETMGLIAIAIGVYAGFIEAYRNNQGITVIRANTNSAFVLKTHERMMENDLTLADAKELFIELMQDEQCAGHLLVADDYIANKFIEEFTVGNDNPRPIRVDYEG